MGLVCQAKFNLPAYLGQDCGGNSLARIEGLSAGIVGGWGQARPPRPETGTGSGGAIKSI